MDWSGEGSILETAGAPLRAEQSVCEAELLAVVEVVVRDEGRLVAPR